MEYQRIAEFRFGRLKSLLLNVIHIRVRANLLTFLIELRLDFRN